MYTCRFLLPLFIVFLFVSILHVTIIHVPADSSTIQSGINGAVDGDTVMVVDGTYTGKGNRDIDFTGNAIVLMSENVDWTSPRYFGRDIQISSHILRGLTER